MPHAPCAGAAATTRKTGTRLGNARVCVAHPLSCAATMTRRSQGGGRRMRPSSAWAAVIPLAVQTLHCGAPVSAWECGGDCLHANAPVPAAATESWTWHATCNATLREGLQAQRTTVRGGCTVGKLDTSTTGKAHTLDFRVHNSGLSCRHLRCCLHRLDGICATPT